jgi:hypothetical protein
MSAHIHEASCPGQADGQRSRGGVPWQPQVGVSLATVVEHPRVAAADVECLEGGLQQRTSPQRFSPRTARPSSRRRTAHPHPRAASEVALRVDKNGYRSRCLSTCSPSLPDGAGQLTNTVRPAPVRSRSSSVLKRRGHSDRGAMQRKRAAARGATAYSPAPGLVEVAPTHQWPSCIGLKRPLLFQISLGNSHD